MSNYEVDVSIVIPSYNMEKFIAQSIKSAIEQDYDSFEVIVCDNCSTDSTYKIAKSIVSGKLKVLTNDSNIGATGNFNRLISEAKGEYIKFLEADDMLEKKCLKKMVSYFNDPSINLATSSSFIIDENDNQIGVLSNKKTQIQAGITVVKNIRTKGNEIGTPSDVMVRSTIFGRVGVFDMYYDPYLNDWDLWIRICRVGNIMFVADKLAKVRRHVGQIGVTGAASNQDIVAVLKMVDRNFKSIDRLKNLVHFSSEYILRATKRLVKFRNKEAVKYLFNTLHVIRDRVNFSILFLGFIYCVVFLPYLKYKAKKNQTKQKGG
jgi:glycosyltransferase involved in cell wall biosynthesis